MITIKDQNSESNVSEEDMLLFINELRSGKYEQGTDALNPAPGIYCCLGVGCKVFIEEEKQATYLGQLVGVMPNCIYQPYAPLWLQDLSSDFGRLTGIGLSNLNDDGHLALALSQFTFDEIADLLQLVYIEKILDDDTQ